MGKIAFIGGTGRSGTNILREMLGRHSQVATLPFEYRFIIDPDGIIDFYRTYTSIWSPYIADRKIKRLEQFLSDLSKDKFIDKIIGKILKPISRNWVVLSPKRYLGWELEKHIPNFQKYSEELIRELKDFSYKAVWPGKESYRFFPELYYGSPKSSEELAGILSRFLEKIINSLLIKNGKGIFIEDNTWNILFSRELVRLLPEAKIIHVYRDPRDVVASFCKQRWAPNKPKEAAIYYRDIIGQWFSLRPELLFNSYYEFKLEDLVCSPETVMRGVCDFVGLPFQSQIINVDLTKSNKGIWKRQFSKEEKAGINEILGDIIAKLGYTK